VNPCGGTHVVRTGEIGLIKIVHLDYRGDETRVEFLCGKRALDDYRSRNDMVSRLANMLTVGYWELDQAVERLQAEGKQLRKGLRQARKRLLKVEASELAETAVPLTHERGSYRVVYKVWEQTGESPEELRALAHELTQRSDVTAFLVSVGVERTHLIFARNLDAEVDLDVATLLRDACTQLGGKGGGRPHFAQGSAPVTDVARVRTALADLLSPLGVPILK
jgi:alanyl-tRNA synthetase